MMRYPLPLCHALLPLVAALLLSPSLTRADEAIGIALFVDDAEAKKPADAPAVEGADKEGKKDKEGAAAEEPEVEPTPAVVIPLGPKYIRMHLQDGSVISGDLTVAEIEVTTQFGKLIVPIEKVRSFSPGLDSNPKLNAEIKELIDKLGAEDYKAREQAHRDLVARGLRIRQQLSTRAGDENAEIKRHIGDILKEFDQLEEEREEDEEESRPDSPLIAEDTIVTSDFTIIGKVSPTEFTVESKYGPLKVALADVSKAEREVVAGKQQIRKSVSIQGTNLAIRGFKSTGIRLQAGDRVSIKADGSIVLSPWGNNAQTTPDGMPNYGWYIPNQIPTGALCGKIGDKGQPFKVGRSFTITAKNAGVLQLALGMPAEYSGEGYQFPGEFKVKIKVDPK